MVIFSFQFKSYKIHLLISFKPIKTSWLSPVVTTIQESLTKFQEKYFIIEFWSVKLSIFKYIKLRNKYYSLVSFISRSDRIKLGVVTKNKRTVFIESYPLLPFALQLFRLLKLSMIEKCIFSTLLFVWLSNIDFKCN